MLLVIGILWLASRAFHYQDRGAFCGYFTSRRISGIRRRHICFRGYHYRANFRLSRHFDYEFYWAPVEEGHDANIYSARIWGWSALYHLLSTGAHSESPASFSARMGLVGFHWPFSWRNTHIPRRLTFIGRRVGTHISRCRWIERFLERAIIYTAACRYDWHYTAPRIGDFAGWHTSPARPAWYAGPHFAHGNSSPHYFGQGLRGC